MAYRLFTVPIAQPDGATKELNQFLASHQVVEVDRQFHGHGSQACWCFCVNYVSTSQPSVAGSRGQFVGKIDYREVLSEEDFVVFAKLRELRKQIAEESSVPVFAIFTNEHLAEMARRRVDSLAKLEQIDGIGPKKLESYGERFLELLRQKANNSA